MYWPWIAVTGIAMGGCSGSLSKPKSLEIAAKWCLATVGKPLSGPCRLALGFFCQRRRARLRYGWAEPQGNRKGLIVLLLAYQATAKALFETFRDLLDAGYAVWVLDRSGQGGSDRWLNNPQKNYSIGVEHDENDVEQLVLQVVQGEPGDARFLVGESLGDHIGFRVLHDYPGHFQAAALSSPSTPSTLANFLKDSFVRSLFLKSTTAKAVSMRLASMTGALNRTLATQIILCGTATALKRVSVPFHGEVHHFGNMYRMFRRDANFGQFEAIISS